MDNEAKHRCDALLAIYNRAWEQFNDRRRHEFKVSLTIWASLAAAIAGSVKLGTEGHSPQGVVAIGLLIGLPLLCKYVVDLHNMWLRGIWRGQNKDRAVAIFCQTRVQELADALFTADVQTILNEGHDERHYSQHPNAQSQIGATRVLAGILLVFNYLFIIQTYAADVFRAG